MKSAIVESCESLVGQGLDPGEIAHADAAKLIVQNIKTHFEKLCIHELRHHGFISPDHDIAFQVFRVLCGYREALEELAAIKEAVIWLMECAELVTTMRKFWIPEHYEAEAWASYHAARDKIIWMSPNNGEQDAN